MLFGQILIFVLFFLVLTNCVFGTYEESHDVTRCVMLNGVPMVGAEGGFIHRRRGWRPRGAWGATWGPAPPAIWGNLTPMMIRLSCEVRNIQFGPETDEESKVWPSLIGWKAAKMLVVKKPDLFFEASRMSFLCHVYANIEFFNMYFYLVRNYAKL